jgi:23S rRNA pseudouridine1911/1915/1917 synthase
VIKIDASGERLDRAIAARIDGASVREVRAALKEGRILVNGKKRAPGDLTRGGEDVDISRFAARASASVEGDPDLLARSPILYDGPHLLALDKPSGIQCAPLHGTEGGTLLSAAIAHDPRIADAGPPLEGGLLHRLDRDTSGVVLFAKDVETRDEIREAFSAHRVEKRYLAVVDRPDLPDSFVVDVWIVQAGDRVRLAEPFSEGALHARSEIHVLKRSDSKALVEAQTFSGRRHQIRIQLQSVDAPIAGDAIYGDANSAPRLALHASAVRLPEQRTIEARLPRELEALLK